MLHRHSAPYLALVLEGGYEECSVDGVWRCEPGELVVHPSLHLHINRFSQRRIRVLNIVLPARPGGPDLRYGVYRPRGLGSIRSLQNVEGEALADILTDAERSRPVAPSSAISTMVEQLASDPPSSIRAAANHAAKTREHASRTFRRHFGFSPSVFRSELRFRRALALLAESTASLASVALDAGFADQAHFTRDFRSRTGTSPGSFRRSFRLRR